MTRPLALILLLLALFVACEAWISGESVGWVRTGINSPEGRER